jgi:hypothetical protein
LIESCFGFSLQAVKLQQFFGQSTKGTETGRELSGKKERRRRKKKKKKKKRRKKKKEEGRGASHGT